MFHECIFKLLKSTPNSNNKQQKKTTKNKVNAWLEEADRFKNGALAPDTARGVLRDAFLLNGLPSPRESDVKLSLKHACHDNDGVQFSRGKLALELEKLIRKELRLRSGLHYPS